MKIFGRIFNSRRQRSEELDVEIQSHLEMAVRERIAAGASSEVARAEALREFGNVSQIKQTTREIWGGTAFENLKHDVRYALRALNGSRGFTVTAIATLAIGISAATVIFSVADHVVLRPLAYPDADRLFVIHEQIREMRDQFPRIPANVSHFLEWQRLCKECESMATMRQGGLSYGDGAEMETVGTVCASWNMLPLLGARMTVGRLFTQAEDNEARGKVVVLSNAFWQRKFGSDRNIVGKSIQLSGSAWQVIGVLAPDFLPPKGTEISNIERLPKNVEIFVPLALTEQDRTATGNFDYTVIAKLTPHATLAQAQSRLAGLQKDILSKRTDNLTIDVFTTPMQSQILGTSKQGLLVLLAAVGAILLIVCVNLANLLLARQASRTREAALRIALGATQGRLVRQTLIESLLVAMTGGALGVLLSRWGLQLLLHFAPADFPRLAEVTLDLRVMTVAALTSVLTGFLFGVVPALRYGRVQPASVLKSGSRNMTDGRSALRTRAFLVASQIGLSAALLYAAGLFFTSFVRLLDVDKGFNETHMLAIDLSLPRSVYFRPDQRVGFYDEVLAKLAALPGVRASGVTNLLPLEGETQVNPISRENDQRTEAERPVANIRQIDPGYFAAMGIPAKRGRLITQSDRGRNVVVLSERAARGLWPGEDPIGKRMLPPNDPISEVVGVVADIRTSNIEREGSLVVYVPYWERAPLQSTLIISTSADPELFAASARAAIHDVGKAVPVSEMRTIEQIVSNSMAPRRFQLLLLLIFAGSALIIASIGIYGVISHSLVKRSNEIGVRMALGAERGSIHRLVLMETLTPVSIGLSIGIPFILVLAQLFRTMLFQVKPINALTLIVVVGVLIFVAAVACLVPARRASGVGALLALRAE
ncbi:MAG: ABC transporter permease [Gemmatimonadaceae bacterium]